MKSSARVSQLTLWIYLVSIWPSAIAFGPSQFSQQSSSPAPSQPAQKEDSAADAAKKTQKEKPKPKKVYTEDDLSGLKGNGVSVVGDRNSSGANSNATNQASPKSADGRPGAGVVPMSGQDEDYWRGKARELLDEMAALDQEMAKTKDEIKKFGADGFDATSGLQKNIIYIDNRNAKLQQMEKRKADLEKKLDQLQEEGRKAGAAPAWFR
jgi:hypothetical protein